MAKRIAYVTGGMGGIGTAICQRLYTDGLTVVAGCGPNSPRRERWLAEQAALGYTFIASEGNVADWDRIRHRVHFSREFAGFHLAFVDVWPDSAERVWLGSDLASVGAEPTLLFTHDPPEVDARHFTNPAAGHPLDRAAGFENVLPEVFHDGPVADSDPDREIDSLAAFLRRHPNLFAWFHGHANFDQAYRWRGVPVFRVDSPLKGGFSGLDARDGRGDESLLSFQVVTVDSAKGRLTVRECLWNSARAAGPLRWGRSTTLEVRR